MKAVAIFLILAIKYTLITVPCNENVPRLLLQQLSDDINPNPGPVSASTAGKINCLMINATSLKRYHKDSTTTAANPCVTSIASRTWCTPKTLTLYVSMRMVEPKYQQL